MKMRMLCLAVATGAAMAMDAHASHRPTTVLLQPSPPPVTGAQKGSVATPAEDEDFYYYQGERIPLVRSATEIVVRVRHDGTDSLDLAPGVELRSEIVTEGRAFELLDVPAAAHNTLALVEATDQLRSGDDVEFVGYVYTHALTNTRMLPTDQIVVKLLAGSSKEELIALAAELHLTIEKTLWGTTDEYILRLNDAKHDDPLLKARLLYESHRVQWAEPNFIRQYEKSFTPNDTLFGNQWHLNNTGQGGGTAGADVKATSAWNLQTGSSLTTIAIVDDGAEKTHEDLAANIFTNPGEIAGNGIDDDHNGYIDDVHGWDFSNDDNDASPFSSDDNHGTAVSGVAAARGNNALGVTGACQNCKILPVKIFSPDYAGDVATANALRYAASFADVINNSWGGGAPSATLQSAIQTATTNGRAGKGSVVLFASGNYASGNFMINGPVLPAGTHRFRWTYSKDISISDGDDTSWLSWALFPSGELANFESGSLPAGFTTGGNASWTVVNDPRHSDEGHCYTHAAKAGTITDSQTSYIQAVRTLPSGFFYSYQWVSGEEDFDGLTLEIDLNNDGSIDLATSLITGVPFIDTGVSYPAAYPESIAVGASTNFDCRSYYSQYGPQLAFVAPSNGGPLNLGIQTTDRSGGNGYDASNYTATFGGTSSATPLSSGIAGLILSRNPSLTRAQVKSAMQSSADHVGPEPYISGRNDRYGSGRLNASQALLSIASCAGISLAPSVLPNGQTFTTYNQSLVASGGTPSYSYAKTVGSLPPGLTLSAAGVLSGTPTSAGTYSFSVRATDASSCSGYRAYNMVVSAGTAPSGTRLYVVTPCRVIDTRNPNGPSGGPALANLATRDVQVGGTCGIPVSAVAVVANITAVAPTSTGFLALYPGGTTWPGNSTISYRTAKTRANNAILPISNTGVATVRNNGSTQHFIIDVTGYFQ